MKKHYDVVGEKIKRLKGGVIIEVTTPEQALIAEEAGACAVMALERVPSAARVSRMSDPKIIKDIQNAVNIPVMAKVRIGHFVEAEILEALEIDCIDESEALSPADDKFHVDKRMFLTPFICGVKDLGEALRRIDEGAAMLRTKSDADKGDIIKTVSYMRAINEEIKIIQSTSEDELLFKAKDLQVSYELVKYIHKNGCLPVLNFAAGGVVTPADAVLMMKLGAQGVFVSSSIFKSCDPKKRADAIVKAVDNFEDAKLIAELSEDLGEVIVGISENEIEIAREIKIDVLMSSGE